MSPATDPDKANIVTTKQTYEKVFRATHKPVHAWMFLCIKYISTGKYIDNGQKIRAPRIPNTWLK